MVLPMTSGPRSVKIGENERGGWTSERPRRPGEAERPPRPVDVSVRGRVLAPSDSLRYSPGSLLLIACADPETRDGFAARVISDAGALLSRSKVRALLEGRVADDVIDEKTQALLDGAARKRLSESHTVVIALEGLDPAEREHFVRLAHAIERLRHDRAPLYESCGGRDGTGAFTPSEAPTLEPAPVADGWRVAAAPRSSRMR